MLDHRALVAADDGPDQELDDRRRRRCEHPARRDDGGRAALRSKTSMVRITVRWASGKRSGRRSGCRWPSCPSISDSTRPDAPNFSSMMSARSRVVLAEQAQRVELVGQPVEEEPLAVLGLATRGGPFRCHVSQGSAAPPPRRGITPRGAPGGG